MTNQIEFRADECTRTDHVRTWTGCVVVALLTVAVTFGCGGDIPATPSSDTDPLAGERINSYYTNDEIRYFLDIALGSYGPDSVLLIRKWTEDVRVAFVGEPDGQDSNAVKETLEDLNDILTSIELSLSDDRPHIRLFVVPHDEFHLYEPAASRDAPWGATYVWREDFSYSLTRASVMVASDTWSLARAVSIRRHLTSALGLLNDSEAYPESIFYRKGNDATSFAPIDEVILELHDLPEVKPGMERHEVIDALTNR